MRSPATKIRGPALVQAGRASRATSASTRAWSPRRAPLRRSSSSTSSPSIRSCLLCSCSASSSLAGHSTPAWRSFSQWHARTPWCVAPRESLWRWTTSRRELVNCPSDSGHATLAQTEAATRAERLENGSRAPRATLRKPSASRSSSDTPMIRQPGMNPALVR
jgi:hypothetical protein